MVQTKSTDTVSSEKSKESTQQGTSAESRTASVEPSENIPPTFSEESTQLLAQEVGAEETTQELTQIVATARYVSETPPILSSVSLEPQPGPSGKRVSSSADESTNSDEGQRSSDRPWGRFVRQTGRKSTTPIREVVPTHRPPILEEDSSDEEGYYTVKSIKSHRGKPPKREFLVQWTDLSETWEPESHCDGAVNLINAYCNRKRLEKSKLKPRGEVGYSGDVVPIKENWATIADILEKAAIYGNKRAIQPEEFVKLGKQDAIYVVQIGNHCFVVLYYHQRKLAIVADDGNLFEKDEVAQQFIASEFRGIDIKSVPFTGQNRTNRCASSAVGIILDFQIAHSKGEIPKEVKPSRLIFERVNSVLHKVDSAKTTSWTPINEQRIGITCPKCGKNYRYAKNRNVLNLHRCQDPKEEKGGL